jgi:hypothetical protein
MSGAVAGVGFSPVAAVPGYRFKKTDVLRCHVDGEVPATAAYQSLSFSEVV